LQDLHDLGAIGDAIPDPGGKRRGQPIGAADHLEHRRLVQVLDADVAVIAASSACGASALASNSAV
jgi:hypothetical protein